MTGQPARVAIAGRSGAWSDRLARGLDPLPSSPPEPIARLLWLAALVALLLGVLAWTQGSLAYGVAALWCFSIMAIALALVLPWEYAFVSPAFAGIAGWLIDMLPLVMLVGWATVALRWGVALLRERRLPYGGRWIWLPIALAAWTALGILVVDPLDRRHFMLLFGIQVLCSAVLLAVVDRLRTTEQRTRCVSALVSFIVALSVAVVLQWVGVPIQPLQNDDISETLEAAYGVDAFPNNLGMIKYGRSSNAGARQLRNRMERWHRAHPRAPDSEVFLPKFQAYDNHLVVRFAGSAREFEDELRPLGVELLYDNVGLVPANTVPRFRSLARNSLTYAGACVVLFPFALFLAWSGARRRRWLGWAGVVACMVGAGFSLARGAWLAILIGVIYIVVDAVVSRRLKLEAVAIFVLAAAAVAAIYLAKYGVDPLTARAEAQGSINTRAEVYSDTLQASQGIHLLLGYGTERPRTEGGVSHVLGRYIPDAGTHSTYLNYLFRTGLPGVVMIAAIYAAAALHARAAARARAGVDRTFATLATAAVVAAAAHAAVLTLFVEPIYTLVVSLALGLALGAGIDLKTSILPWRTRPAEA